MEWWATMRDLNRCQACWSLYLSRFNFKVTYKKGKLMQADALSRSSQDHVSDREDNHQVCVLGLQHFQTVAATHYKPASDSLGDCICQASHREAEVLEGLKSIDKTAPKALTDSIARWEEDNGFVYHMGRLYVPNVPELRKDVVKTCHNSLTTGHPGKMEPLSWLVNITGGHACQASSRNMSKVADEQHGTHIRERYRG